MLNTAIAYSWLPYVVDVPTITAEGIKNSILKMTGEGVTGFSTTNDYDFGTYGSDFFEHIETIRNDFGIPSDWIATASDADGGVKFINPSNIHDNVRIMPGRPSTPFETTQKPYAKRQRNGSLVDRLGNKIISNGQNQNRSSESHIPLEQFIFHR